MILHTLVWESRTTPRFIWKASASAEAFSFYAPVPCPLWEQRPPLYPLPSMTLPSCPPGGGKGPVMGALPPFEAPFQTPESPPLPRAEALCSLPACSNQSFAFGTGGRIHPSPHGGGGMKSGQGCYPLCVPRPAVGGIAGVRARPEKPHPPGPGGTAGRVKTKRLVWSPLHAILCRQVRVFRKRSFCWNTRTPGGRGDVRL